MSNEKYNGWKNYETWAVKLWLDNDEYTADHWNERATEFYEESEATKHLTRKESAAIDLVKELKQAHEDDMPELNGVYADLLTASLDMVDWNEIACALIDGISEDVDKDEKEEAELEAE